MDKVNDVYETSDIVLAAVIRLTGYELEEIYLDGNRGTFVFKGPHESLIQSFDYGQCRVEPAAFHDMVKQLTAAVRRKQNGR